MQQAGLAVCNDGEGYYLLATDQSIPVELSSVELVSLLYVAQLVKESLPSGLVDDLRSAIDGLTVACGSDEAIRAALDREEGIDISPALTDGPQAVGSQETAIRARRLRKQLVGQYRSPERTSTVERIIHPYTITYRGDAHYLVGYCELREEVRTFRLDRFVDLQVRDAAAEIPKTSI